MKLWEKKRAAAFGTCADAGASGLPEARWRGEDPERDGKLLLHCREVISTDPTHIFEEVKEDFLIDAEISGPPAGVVPKVYRGHYKGFSKEEIDAFLKQVGDGIAEVDSDGIEGKDYYYSGACTDGGYFFRR